MYLNKSNDTSVSEITHDYSAVNKYISHTLDRHIDLLKSKKSQRIKKLIIALSVLVMAVGIAWFLILFGYSLPTSSEHSMETFIEAVEVDSTANKTTVAEDVHKVTVQYTVFQTVRLQQGEEVVTGWTSDPNTAIYPDPIKQYCYHLKQTSTGKGITTDLASKQEKKATVWSVEVSNNLRSLAKLHCRFKN